MTVTPEWHGVHVIAIKCGGALLDLDGQLPLDGRSGLSSLARKRQSPLQLLPLLRTPAASKPTGPNCSMDSQQDRSELPNSSCTSYALQIHM